jgi:hypothetical protein
LLSIASKGFRFEKCGTNSEFCVMLVPVYVFLPKKTVYVVTKRKKNCHIFLRRVAPLASQVAICSVSEKKMRSIRGDHESTGVFVLWSAIHRGSCVREEAMAPSSSWKPSGTNLFRSELNQSVRRSHALLWKQSHRHRGLAGVVRAASDDAPPVVRAAVGAVTELLRALSPAKKPSRRALDHLSPVLLPS